MFTLFFWRKEWMPIVAQTFLHLGLHFKPWGCLPFLEKTLQYSPFGLGPWNSA